MHAERSPCAKQRRRHGICGWSWFEAGQLELAVPERCARFAPDQLPLIRQNDGGNSPVMIFA
jgi:hypothetical protein